MKHCMANYNGAVLKSKNYTNLHTCGFQQRKFHTAERKDIEQKFVTLVPFYCRMILHDINLELVYNTIILCRLGK